MRLATFYDRIGPLLTGQRGHADTVQDLYGPDGQETMDARRLSIYGRFCKVHRFEVVDSVYVHCRAAVVRSGGEEAWEALIEDYFRTHPMRHFELNENGQHLPQHLATQASLPAPPGQGAPPLALPYLPDLADLEWWEWQTQIAPDDPADTEGGPLRVAATLELRRYDHDLVGWLDEGGGPEEGAPEPGESYVLFWRDRDLSSRRDMASLLEMLALKGVSEGLSVAEMAAQGLPADDLRETLGDLHAAGILRGQPPGA